MGTGGPFYGAKPRPGRDADHSPPSSAKAENEEELYLLSPRCVLACSGTALAIATYIFRTLHHVALLFPHLRGSRGRYVDIR
jgi:hypothetical protein